jgi:protocatechuate 3,4-dioxygenase, beta subunit
MIKFNWVIFFFLVMLSACGQTPGNNSKQKDNSKDVFVGGPCDMCDLMYEGMPSPKTMQPEAILANEKEPGERMEISGRLLMKDGKTPAKNIILYMYHTNAAGYYAPADTQATGKRHGHLRGWVNTNEKGEFKFISIRPAPYPGRNIPAHLHILVKEPGKTLYYIDEVWFDDDPLVTKEQRDKAEKRGGDLIIHLAKDNRNVWVGELVITAGLNIPGYK